MASAAGLRLVPKDCRDPTATTTYGVGQLMAAALDQGCNKIIIGCGDSGTSDGGAGMLQALECSYVQRTDPSCRQRREAGAYPTWTASVWMGYIPGYETKNSTDNKVQIEAVCNIKNVLCGPRGVARVYGPQKGATPEQVERLSVALEKLAAAAQPICGGEEEEIGNLPGRGASGGLGAGLLLLGARLRARQEAIDEYFGLATLFDAEPWDIVITGEGSLDSQSTHGKMTVEIAKRAQEHGAKVIALAGSIGEDASEVYQVGISAFMSIVDGPSDLEEAKKHTDKLLRNAAEKAIRMVQAGITLRQNEAPRPAPPVIMPPRKESPRGKLLPDREGDRSLLKFARVATS
ncbi:glycerate kinase [Apiospora phragmitis]|uniref:Glycerate kinase n=1 Tax=Apiospora phragmitis TaxID=2905665 RepID=A0ABR1WA31_9PEZI